MEKNRKARLTDLHESALLRAKKHTNVVGKFERTELQRSRLYGLISSADSRSGWCACASSPHCARATTFIYFLYTFMKMKTKKMAKHSDKKQDMKMIKKVMKTVKKAKKK